MDIVINMCIIIVMNIYITPQNKGYLQSLKARGDSMSALINAFLDAERESTDKFVPKFGRYPNIPVEVLGTKEAKKYPNYNPPMTLPKAPDPVMGNACCQKVKPCKHWQWDGLTSAYINEITGEVKPTV